jgi:hypothetical protein
VLATACRVALVEATGFDALKPFPKEGQKTVGAHVDLSHMAATPMGMRVTAQVWSSSPWRAASCTSSWRARTRRSGGERRRIEAEETGGSDGFS